MLIHSILTSSSVNGPGNRMVVWTQGCVLNCRGCWNQATHSFSKGAELPWERLLETLLATDDLEGITFSGGEPMHQALELSFLMEQIRRSWPECSIGMYTGYTERELIEGNYFSVGVGEDKHRRMWWHDVRRHLDFAVMGRFNELVVDTSRPLCSSLNQNLVLFSDRYTLADFSPQQAEVQIDNDGLVTITGFPQGALI